MPLIDWDVQQGTPAWDALRAGIPTASEFGHIITAKTAKISEQRRAYQCRLVAERVLNWQAQSLDSIRHIEDGKVNEPLAVAQLEEIQQIETRRVGFIRTDDKRFGASPDRVAAVSPDLTHVGITIEVKAPTIPTQIRYLLLGHDDAYRAQVQGQLLVAEADKAIFYAFHPRTPAYQVESGRDEGYIAKLRDCLEQFSDELEEMTLRARSLGLFQPFADRLTPTDAAYDARFRPPSEAELEAFINGPMGEFG